MVLARTNSCQLSLDRAVDDEGTSCSAMRRRAMQRFCHSLLISEPCPVLCGRLLSLNRTVTLDRVLDITL